MEPSDRDDWALPREEAVPRLLDEYGAQLYGLARRICGKVEEAEDLVQEVFLQAWRSWHQFRGDASPRPWLYTIARHACQRMHRKRSGEPEHIASLEANLPFGAPRMAIVASEAEEDASARVEREDLAGQAIAGLPIDFRLALVLKEIIGFSIEEVASILDVPAATVKTRVHRARLKVRSAIEDGLPKRELPPPSYSQQVCLDLLEAKQNALDRGVEMPNADNIICDRCQAVFATLDLTQDVCKALSRPEPVPARLRETLRVAMSRAS